MTDRIEDVQKRLMRIAREVDGLTWADRKCIGEAIAMLGCTTDQQRGAIAYQLTKKIVIDISTARAAVDEALKEAS